MTIKHIDGFDLYSDGNDLNGVYATSNVDADELSTTAGRFGGGAFFSAGAARHISLTATDIQSEPYFVVGAAVKFIESTQDSSFMGVHEFSASTSDAHFTIYRTASGSIKVAGDGNVTLGESAPGVLPQDAWYYVEAKAHIAASGTVDVYVNGSLVVSATGDFSEGSGVSAIVTWGATAGSDDFYLDDIYYAQSATNSLSALGDVKIATVSPDADTATTDWTRNTGTQNFALIDDNLNGDGDTTYISSTTLGHKTQCTLPDLTDTGVTVHSVAVVARSKKTDAGNIEYRPYIFSNATQGNGTSVNPSETIYSLQRDVFNTDPDTAAAWTEAAVNALEVGVEITV